MGWGCDLEDRAPTYACEVLTHLWISARWSSSFAMVWYANDMTWSGMPLSRSPHRRKDVWHVSPLSFFFFQNVFLCRLGLPSWAFTQKKRRVTCYLCNLDAMRPPANTRRYPMVKDVTTALTQMQTQLLIWIWAVWQKFSITDHLPRPLQWWFCNKIIVKNYPAPTCRLDHGSVLRTRFCTECFHEGSVRWNTPKRVHRRWLFHVLLHPWWPERVLVPAWNLTYHQAALYLQTTLTLRSSKCWLFPSFPP